MTTCNSIFELQWPFATHNISTSWVLSNKLHELQKLLDIWCNSLQFNCNFVATTPFQLLCNSLDYNHNVMLTSFFIHSSKFNTWHYEDFCDFFSKYWYPLSIMITHFRWFRLWPMAQSKVAMWHINWIKYIYISTYVGQYMTVGM